MRLSTLLPMPLRQPLRHFRRKVLSSLQGRTRPIADDLSAQIPFGNFGRGASSATANVGVICHLFHAELAGAFRQIFENLPDDATLYISTDDDVKAAVIQDVLCDWPADRLDIRIVANRGRDIAPKLVVFADAYARHDLILFVHSKKSLTSDLGDRWRDMLLQTLAGSRSIVDSIVAMFNRFPDLGIVFPQHFQPIRPLLEWDGNFALAETLASRMGFSLRRSMILDFPSGSMFWARPAALSPLLALNLTIEDFPPEQNQVRGTIQHSVERLFLLVAEHAGYFWLKVASAHDAAADATIRPIASEAALDEFVAAARHGLLPRRQSRS